MRAVYSDGTTRDVTHETMFLTNNDVTTTVDGKGMMTAGTRGEAFVMARFDQITVGTQVLVIPEMPDFKFPMNPRQLHRHPRAQQAQKDSHHPE